MISISINQVDVVAKGKAVADAGSLGFPSTVADWPDTFQISDPTNSYTMTVYGSVPGVVWYRHDPTGVVLSVRE